MQKYKFFRKPPKKSQLKSWLSVKTAITYSPAFAVPSALQGLTSLFGMGRGGALALSSPKFVFMSGAFRFPSLGAGLLRCKVRIGEQGRKPMRGFSNHVYMTQLFASLFLLKSPRAISTARLNVSPRLHLRPIDVVVCDGPHSRPYLGVGFVLRCFQHLSCPDAATRLCHWRDNRYTGGLSSTVLSY